MTGAQIRLCTHMEVEKNSVLSVNSEKVCISLWPFIMTWSKVDNR
jgi:hypothetical protein